MRDDGAKLVSLLNGQEETLVLLIGEFLTHSRRPLTEPFYTRQPPGSSSQGQLIRTLFKLLNGWISDMRGQ